MDDLSSNVELLLQSQFMHISFIEITIILKTVFIHLMCTLHLFEDGFPAM